MYFKVNVSHYFIYYSIQDQIFTLKKDIPDKMTVNFGQSKKFFQYRHQKMVVFESDFFV